MSDQTPTPVYSGTLCIMDQSGDTPVAWTTADPATVAEAEDRFNALVGPSRELRAGRMPYAAFRMNSPTDGAQITAFDATAPQIILVPPLVGG